MTTIEGPLSKWTNVIQGWQFRWFVLDIQNGLLSYYTSKENITKGERRGCIRMKDAFVGYDSEDDITFTISTKDEKTFHLQAKNLMERQKWVSKIEKTIRLHSLKYKEKYNLSYKKYASKIILPLYESSLKNIFNRSNNLFLKKKDFSKEFESLLIECDTFLQILIDKLEQLKKKKKTSLNDPNAIKIKEIQEIKLYNDNMNKFYKNCDFLILAVQNFLETVQHSIVCLKIAKTNFDPNKDLLLKNDLSEAVSHFNILRSINQNKIQISQELEIKTDSNKVDKKKKKLMPTLSYSSSDEEVPGLNLNLIKNKNFSECKYLIKKYEGNDENFIDYEFEENDDSQIFSSQKEKENDSDSFYDAIDQNYQIFDTEFNNINKQISNTFDYQAFIKVEHANNKAENLTHIFEDKENKQNFDKLELKNGTQSSNLSLIDQKIIDEYELFDENELQEDIDMNNEQSVITHLLTQVRIGMDLTKITLPTFILETRSLLEMYADFFAHTDFFLKIVDFKYSHERMVQVVKWYLSTFHAGRKSQVAKKPYNPILGEIFQCWYDVQENKIDISSKDLIFDGPIPWANKDQLTFIAEQVSHHPPISAFYAEHYNKRMQINGYIWTKSKFLGLSIGVQMVGKAVLSLLDYDEEYVMTFPSAFGRSILTVPWFEIGGEVSINCPKSGFFANIQFLTKPFYGGKKHQIQGNIYGPDKKSLYTLDGDWNGTIFIKNGKKQDILISSQNTQIIKKNLRPLNEQLNNESRKLWREVTYYICKKKIDLATLAKQQIEQKQREDAKQRKVKNVKWQAKYFNEDGENWKYVNPLIKRLNSN